MFKAFALLTPALLLACASEPATPTDESAGPRAELAAAPGAAPAEAERAAAPQPVEDAVLVMKPSAADSDAIAGTATSASGTLTFRSEGRVAGAAARRGQRPDHVVATLEVNGATLVHDFDLSARKVVVRSTAGFTLRDRDVKVLSSFQSAFVSAIPSADVENMSATQDALWRLSELYSEIPRGFTISEQWVITPGTAAPDPVDSIDALNATDQLDAAAARCAGESHNSFSDLHDEGDVCNENRSLSKHAGHDYCQGAGSHHGYLLFLTDFGCKASDCKGRCGAGCGKLDGRGAWMHDCLRHDVCNRSHNGSGCNDEFREAADDYLFGPVHCGLSIGGFGCHD